jgi:PKD domain-containing protein
VGAVDAAGNSTPVAQRVPITVELRYITLQKKRLSVAAGREFTIGVSTDAKKYRWKLGGRKSVASGPALTLRASTRRGRYTLTVSANGHSARATVLVR